jgi:hypothetical protein
MTPKEKAIELYVKYRQYTFYVDLVYKEDTLDKFYENAKKCALIAVDEIINNWKNEATIQYPYGEVINYWNVVKEEIKAL